MPAAKRRIEIRIETHEVRIIRFSRRHATEDGYEQVESAAEPLETDSGEADRIEESESLITNKEKSQ